MLIAVFMIPFALLSYPSGRLSERTSRTALLCGGSLLYGLATASVTFWSAPELAAAMGFLGVTAAAMFVPSLLLTTELAPAAVRSTALGAFNAAGSLGFIVGPLTGGAVTELVAAREGFEAGYRAAFLVAGASQVGLALALFAPLWRWERRAR
jgi:MFS family permease